MEFLSSFVTIGVEAENLEISWDFDLFHRPFAMNHINPDPSTPLRGPIPPERHLAPFGSLRLSLRAGRSGQVAQGSRKHISKSAH
ncbi:MAG: hypothetical protein IH594_02335 [Bacteroidales bacterium]|nr:hypothetical protein [Bacteroidales bacterium]